VVEGAGLDTLKMILQQEILNLQSNLQEKKYKSGDATERLLSRIADRNDIIRINTLRWVLEVIENLEHER
jgi:Asp-tRNA(Asn)/Glu-tRNA(Gln) amidotransferase A subunit family amidase